LVEVSRGPERRPLGERAGDLDEGVVLDAVVRDERQPIFFLRMPETSFEASGGNRRRSPPPRGLADL